MVTKSKEWWVDAEPSEIEELKAALTEREERINELEEMLLAERDSANKRICELVDRNAKLKERIKTLEATDAKI